MTASDVGGKGFQGVWLEHADDQRFVIAYRPREYWQAFKDHEVIVTGQCYQPAGQAIAGTHYRVDTMRFLKPTRGVGPILEVGPEVRTRGKLVKRDFPAGSKREGSHELRFVEDGGAEHGIQGTTAKLDRVKPDETITIDMRSIVPDMSWTAQTGGSKIWIVEIVHQPDDPAYADTPVGCP